MKMPFLKWGNRGRGESRGRGERERTALYLFDPILTEWMKWEVTTDTGETTWLRKGRKWNVREESRRDERKRKGRRKDRWRIFLVLGLEKNSLCPFSPPHTLRSRVLFHSLSFSLPRFLPLFLMFPSPSDIFLLLSGLTNQQPGKRVTAPGSPSEPLNGIDREVLILSSLQLHSVSFLYPAALSLRDAQNLIQDSDSRTKLQDLTTTLIVLHFGTSVE